MSSVSLASKLELPTLIRCCDSLGVTIGLHDR